MSDKLRILAEEIVLKSLDENSGFPLVIRPKKISTTLNSLQDGSWKNKALNVLKRPPVRISI